jgi:hypothetical protein
MAPVLELRAMRKVRGCVRVRVRGCVTLWLDFHRRQYKRLRQQKLKQFEMRPSEDKRGARARGGGGEGGMVGSSKSPRNVVPLQRQQMAGAVAASTSHRVSARDV